MTFIMQQDTHLCRHITSIQHLYDLPAIMMGLIKGEINNVYIGVRCGAYYVGFKQLLVCTIINQEANDMCS